MSNKKIYNKNVGYKPVNSPKKKNTFSFYLVLVLMCFCLLGAVLGSWAFVENRVKADTGINNQLNYNTLSSSSFDFNIQYSNSLFTVSHGPITTDRTASFRLATFDVQNTLYTFIANDTLPLQGVRFLFMGTGAHPTVWKTISTTNTESFTLPYSAVGTVGTLWLFIDKTFDSTIQSFSFVCGLYSDTVGYSNEYLKGYTNGLFENLMNFGIQGFFALPSYTYTQTLVNQSLSDFQTFTGSVNSSNITLTNGGFYFNKNDFQELTRYNPSLSYTFYHPNTITFDFGDGVDIRFYKVITFLDSNGSLYNLSSDSCTITFVFDHNFSRDVSFINYGNISSFDLRTLSTDTSKTNVLKQIIFDFVDGTKKPVGLSLTSLNNTLFQNGYQVGYKEGTDQAFSQGYRQGKEYGYRQGQLDGNPYTFTSLLGAVIDAPLTALSGLLDFNVLGFNLLTFFKSLITVIIVVFVIKLFI